MFALLLPLLVLPIPILLALLAITFLFPSNDQDLS